VQWLCSLQFLLLGCIPPSNPCAQLSSDDVISSSYGIGCNGWLLLRATAIITLHYLPLSSYIDAALCRWLVSAGGGRLMMVFLQHAAVPRVYR